MLGKLKNDAYFDEGVVGDTRFPRPFQSLRLYLDSRMLDFRHLPEAGGLLDQDAQLLADWRIIRAIDVAAQDDRNNVDI